MPVTTFCSLPFQSDIYALIIGLYASFVPYVLSAYLPVSLYAYVLDLLYVLCSLQDGMTMLINNVAKEVNAAVCA